MSGTSLDGLDLALCRFTNKNHKISYELLTAETIPYDDFWKNQLSSVFNYKAADYFELHVTYGAFIAKSVSGFLARHQQHADYISSHGHTVFHQPDKGFSTQIGCGATIMAHTGINTICDFRSVDVANKGQGAPLVPIGDRDLFGNYESCLNLGGIANISFTKDNTINAFDICFANMPLNYLSSLNGQAFDPEGRMAASGTVNIPLLNTLLKINTKNASLGRELYEHSFLPLLTNTLSTEDNLATICEYIAIKIHATLKTHELKSVLITGGGAYNSYLIERIKNLYTGKVFIPEDQIIQFKEAIIFAYLGYLRIHNKENALSSVTGAHKNSIGGCIYKS